jgi:hypothetical protein
MKIKKQVKIRKIELEIIYIFISLVITKFFALFFNLSSTVGGTKILMVPEINMFIPFLILLPIFKNYKHNKLITFLGFIGSLLTIIYNPTGKSILIIILVLILYLFFLMKEKKYIDLFFIIILFVSFIITIFILYKDLIFSNYFLLNKIREIRGLFEFWKPNWYDNMPISPKYRVVQFVNIAIEFIKKPYFIIFGKGYIGTYKDYIDGFSAGYQSAFTKAEYIRNTFYYTHDAINVIFLSHGFFGIFFSVYLIKLLFKKVNFWLIIGVLWFLIFYGFSFTLSVFGSTCLFLGFNKLYYSISGNIEF